jgi:hypothetical protein
MKKKNTLILIVVVALLAGYFFLVEQPRHRRSAEEALKSGVLAPFDIDQADAVTIERPDATIRLQRDGRRWRITEPLSDRANDGAVNQLVGLLSRAEIDRDLGPQDDLSPFGLDHPEATVTVFDADGSTLVSLDVGKLTVDSRSAYARDRAAPETGAAVLLLPTGVRRYSLVEVSRFRVNRLVEYTIESVKSVTVHRPDGTMTWRRDDGGDWATEVRGVRIRGNNGEVESVLKRLRGLRAAEFVPALEAPVIRPFDAPARSVEITLDGGVSQTVRFGRRMDDYVYASSRLADEFDERVVLTDTTALVVFHQTVDDLRDRRLLRFDRKSVGKVELVSPDIRVTLIRSGDGWGYPNPALGGIDRKQVIRLFGSMELLEYTRVVDEDPSRAQSYRLSKPDFELTIFDEAGSQIDRLVCTRSPGESSTYLANSGHADVVAEVAAEDLAALVEAFEDLRQQ